MISCRPVTPPTLPVFMRVMGFSKMRAFPFIDRLRESRMAGNRLRSDSNLTQLAAIRAGFGIGLCQVVIAQRDPTLVRVLDDISFALPLWIAMHEDMKTSTRYRVVFDMLVEGMSAAAGHSPDRCAANVA